MILLNYVFLKLNLKNYMLRQKKDKMELPQSVLAFKLLDGSLSSCYRTVSSAVWEIFSEFFIFCNLFHEYLGE